MVPGTSRSGATISAGCFLGLSRKTADGVFVLPRHTHHVRRDEYDLYKNWHLFDPGDIPLFAIGVAASFASALLAVRTLIVCQPPRLHAVRVVTASCSAAWCWDGIFGLVTGRRPLSARAAASACFTSVSSCA